MEELPDDNPFDALLQEVAKMQRLQESLGHYLDDAWQISSVELLSDELDRSLDRSPNAVEILQLLAMSAESVTLELAQRGLHKVRSLQDNLAQIRQKQLEEFKAVKHVKRNSRKCSKSGGK